MTVRCFECGDEIHAGEQECSCSATKRDWFPVRSTPTEKEAYGPVSKTVEIETREGTVVAEPGDYIIREQDGNLYPIGPEKFAQYYERL